MECGPRSFVKLAERVGFVAQVRICRKNLMGPRYVGCGFGEPAEPPKVNDPCPQCHQESVPHWPFPLLLVDNLRKGAYRLHGSADATQGDTVLVLKYDIVGRVVERTLQRRQASRFVMCRVRHTG